VSGLRCAALAALLTFLLARACRGVLSLGLGICSGWGWGMIFGMPFTSLQELSPFILLGMGIDVMVGAGCAASRH
jgi:predicted acyltransferase